MHGTRRTSSARSTCCRTRRTSLTTSRRHSKKHWLRPQLHKEFAVKLNSADTLIDGGQDMGEQHENRRHLLDSAVPVLLATMHDNTDHVTFKQASLGHCDSPERAAPWSLSVTNIDVGPVRLGCHPNGLVCRQLPEKAKLRLLPQHRAQPSSSCCSSVALPALALQYSLKRLKTLASLGKRDC